MNIVLGYFPILNDNLLRVLIFEMFRRISDSYSGPIATENKSTSNSYKLEYYQSSNPVNISPMQSEILASLAFKDNLTKLGKLLLQPFQALKSLPQGLG